ncbi:MAG: hypothetical protein ACI8RZ_001155, partial [Myxococcota bacterium]
SDRCGDDSGCGDDSDRCGDDSDRCGDSTTPGRGGDVVATAELANSLEADTGLLSDDLVWEDADFAVVRIDLGATLPTLRCSDGGGLCSRGRDDLGDGDDDGDDDLRLAASGLPGSRLKGDVVALAVHAHTLDGDSSLRGDDLVRELADLVTERIELRLPSAPGALLNTGLRTGGLGALDELVALVCLDPVLAAISANDCSGRVAHQGDLVIGNRAHLLADSIKVIGWTWTTRHVPSLFVNVLLYLDGLTRLPSGSDTGSVTNQVSLFQYIVISSRASRQEQQTISYSEPIAEQNPTY